jgi:hypothetical protein
MRSRFWQTDRAEARLRFSAPGGVFSRLFDHYLHDRYEQGGASGFASVSDATEQVMWRAALATRLSFVFPGPTRFPEETQGMRIAETSGTPSVIGRRSS